MLRENSPRALRNAAYRQQGGLCHWCKQPMVTTDRASPRYATAEHVIPKYAGGRTVHGNIVAACAKCNNERNVETNRSRARGVLLTIGDTTPCSPFEVLADGYNKVLQRGASDGQSGALQSDEADGTRKCAAT